MRFHVDVQIHSKYSRATAKNADIEHLALWARKKGITVLGTGDFTHPAWLAEIKDKLVPAEPGLFRLNPDLERWVEARAPAACAGPMRFMLEVEISTIYKKADKVRKIHHLIFVPDLAAADRLVASLSRIGNLASDGRPILGLDSRDLLEITLETGPHSYLIPAHIWTPWFAVLGSKSGFDSVDDCYGDLAEHVFAVETGLSSDPEMNWRVSSLDRFRLVSNSDAHSPPKIGREATTYDTDLDYFAIRSALETGDGFVGTVEFFPEEGKYHMDGHRKCGVRLTPAETKAAGGRCPVCGGELTVGVLHRIDALADRPADGLTPSPKAGEVLSLVPLPEMLSEILGTGPGSKRVAQAYERLLATLGPETAILETVPIEDIARAEPPLLAEAVSRLRAGKVIREPGYDGEYGVIRLFEEAELRDATAGGLLFELPEEEAPRSKDKTAHPGRTVPPKPDRPTDAVLKADPAAGDPGDLPPMLSGLDDDQRTAAQVVHGPLLIVAGPGSGKTRTLTRRIAHLVADHGVEPSGCLAVTFTRRAAAEMRDRLVDLLGASGGRVPVHTFHSLGLAILREHPEAAGLRPGFAIADADSCTALLAACQSISERKARALLRIISKAKRTRRPPQDLATAEAMAAYDRALAGRNQLDFDDLVARASEVLAAQPALAVAWRARFPYISVDEFQDVDEQQYRLVRLLAGAVSNVCVIGDPNQAIYGFRGGDASCFDRFREEFRPYTLVRLTHNYRSSGTIVAASSQVIGPSDGEEQAARIVRAMADRITIHKAQTARAEAEYVVHGIEQMIGGHSFFSLDSGRAEAAGRAELSFADFAVLYRTDAQADVLAEAFARSGMPFQRHGHARLADRPAVHALLAALEAAADRVQLGTALEQAARHLRSAEDGPDAGELEDAVARLAAVARRAGDDRGRFLAEAMLTVEADDWDPRADRVSLLTLHAAKGLEFPVVFITGLEDGILPLTFARAEPEALAEERRLFYVGMTRAMDSLILTRAAKRSWRGAVRTLAPSPFLQDIEDALLQESERKPPPRKPALAQLDLF